MRMRDVLQHRQIRPTDRARRRPLPTRGRGPTRVARRSYPASRCATSDVFHIILAGLYRLFLRLNPFLKQQASSGPHVAGRAMRGMTASFSPRRRIVFLALGYQPPTYSRILSRFPVCLTRQSSPVKTVTDQQSGKDLYGAAACGGGNRSCLNLTEVPGRIRYFLLAVGRAPPVGVV